MSDPQPTLPINQHHDDLLAGEQKRATIEPLKIEGHMLSIASMLFDALRELPGNHKNTLDIIDNKN